MAENLWPENFGELNVTTPVAILRENATGLGDRTKNIVVASVQPGSPSAPDKFRYLLYLRSGMLNYQMPLLYIEHGIELYPVEIRVEGVPDVQATNPEELLTRLKEIFSSEKTKKTIASLIAQAKG